MRVTRPCAAVICRNTICAAEWHYAMIMSFMKNSGIPPRTKLNMPKNGRVVIPADFRKALGRSEGGELILRWEDDELRISTMKQNIERAQRRARQYLKPGVSLVDELIAERREAAKRELE